MAGLVGYASSDEGSEEEEQQAPPQQQKPSTTQQPGISNQTHDTQTQPPPPPQAVPAQPGPLQPTPVGPSLPPMAAVAPQTQEEQLAARGDDGAAPSSPYSTARSLIHDLTLPSIPNFDIPPSPPPPSSSSQSEQQPSSSSSSAAASAAATNKKFEQFIQLKKKGTHFNAKLEQSAALRNPALTDKLLAFVDVGAGGSGNAGTPLDTRVVAEYTTTLPAEVWDPQSFPDWAFRSRLRRTRDVVAKERESARSGPGRSTVEFVAAASSSTE